jgi:hypothetical protein
MIRKTTILFLMILLSAVGFTQPKTIKVEANNLPLNVVLLQLRNQYDFQFSYSENQLSRYKVTVSKTFSSKDEAIEFLLKDLPFQLKKMDGVFIIIPDKKKQKDEKKKEQTRITGQIVESGSDEPLPFSRILINNHPMIADVTGSFNFTSPIDSSFHVHISHLGYYIYDTILYASNYRQYKLIPSSVKLPEVTIQNNVVEKATIVGETIGKITLNNNISRYLPGQGDNSVFNHIRLMPGIQAAGEQSADLLIWGSSEGQSLITFDEFTFFGLKNYNDNINVVNPFLVKNIEIFKGGFEAKYGNRVGGIVNITGKNGNLQKPVFNLNINPTTLNGMVELPIFKKSSLVLAYRQTYYNLYNSGDFNIFAPTRTRQNNQNKGLLTQNQKFDMSVYPDDYQFRDMNLKFSHQFDNGDQFYVSAYGGGDYFHLIADASFTHSSSSNPGKIDTPLTITLLNKEKNRQHGMSALYNKTWSNKLTSKFIFSHSDFSKQLSDEIQSVNTITQNIYKKDNTSTDNSAIENSLRIENILHLLNGHQIEFGGGFYNNEAKIDFNTNMASDTLTIDTVNKFKNNRFFGYFDDYLPIGNRLILKTGARVNFSGNNLKLYFEPRISATYKLSERLKLNASWGRYHQFIFKEASVDHDKNYSYLWVTSNENTPVINATHWVSGINYFKNNLTINLEGYYKLTHNITQRVFEQRFDGKKRIDGYFPYFGNAKTYGLDLFAKKDFGKHSIWASYTLSKAFESLALLNQPLPAYKLAPQHQLHELKVAGLFNVHHFYFSADYVYGSGVEILRKIFAGETGNVAYHRVDAAVTYKFTPKHFSGEVGFSVLNLLDTQNLKYANFKNIQLTSELGDVRVYSDAVPFTPILFLKLSF